MNNSFLILGIIFILLFELTAIGQNLAVQDAEIENVEIKFEKKISTSLEASLGTINMAQIGDFLILHDSHVSNRKLVCINYSSGKKVWEIETDVHRFYIYNNLVIVNFDNSIEAYNVETGVELWRMESTNISYSNNNASELSNNTLAFYKDEKVILNLKTQSIKSFDNKVVEAYYFQVNETEVIKSKIGTENNYSYKGELLAVTIIVDAEGIRQDYVWSLDDNRKFYLVCFDENNKEIYSNTWNIDEGERLPENWFSGVPEPEKLANSIYFINGKLFLFENYVNYRWSWNRGCNRITCVDWETGNIEYQKWGQNPKEETFKTFQFFNNTILYCDNTMHFQEGEGSFSKFDSKNGEVLDSLPQKATLFKNYNSTYLLGFNYERKLIKESEYNNAVEMKLWNIKTNKFSKTFRFDYKQDYPYDPDVFSNNGLVILYFYLEDINQSMLHCYRVKI